MSKMVSIFFAFTILLFSSCSDNSVDGSGTGTGNPIIIGQVISDNDSAFSNVIVKLRPVNYYNGDSASYISENNLYKIRDVKTDECSRFVIDSVDSGEYSIEVSGKNSESVLYNCLVNLNSDSLFLDYNPVLPNDTIRGYSLVYGGANSEKKIYVEGLERTASTMNDSFYIIVPVGVYNLKAVTERNETAIVTDVNSYCTNLDINILALNPLSSSYICDTLIVRAILDSNGISRSALAHAFRENVNDNYVFQIDIEDPSFYTLPAIIAGVRRLVELEIQFGNLSSLPPEIGLLSKLEELELNNNKLTTLPIEIINLTPIDELNLSGNNFSDLPQDIIDWGNNYNALW